MAKFGKDLDPNQEQNDFIDAQINETQADLQDKRDDLQRQQLAIVKSEGGQNWNGEFAKAVPKVSPAQRMGGALKEAEHQLFHPRPYTPMK